MGAIDCPKFTHCEGTSGAVPLPQSILSKPSLRGTDWVCSGKSDDEEEEDEEDEGGRGGGGAKKVSEQ